MRRRTGDFTDPLIGLVVGLGVLVMVGGIAFSVVGSLKTEAIVLTVDRKERVGEDYLVWSEEGETFKVADSILHTRFDSSDDYGAIVPGQRLNCRALGFRVPFLSEYRNLLDCRVVVGE